MSPTFFAAGAMVATETPGGTIAPLLPADTAVNDVGLMCVQSNASNAFPAITGWSDLGTPLQAAGMSARWYGRRLDGGADDEPDPFTVASGTALSTTNALFGRIYVFRDCITTGDPWEDVTTNGAPTNSTTPTTLDIDTTGADRLAVGVAAIDDNTAFASGLPPADWTQAGTHAVDGLGGDAGQVAIVRAVPAAGTVTGVVIGTLGTTENWHTLALALIPAAAGDVTGTVAGELPELTGDLAGVGEADGTAAGVLPELAGELAGAGTGAVLLSGNLPELGGALAGAGAATGAAAGALPELDGQLAGVVAGTATGTVSGDLPELAGQLAGTGSAGGTVAGALAELIGELTGIREGGVVARLRALQTTTLDIYAPAVAPDEWSGARTDDSLVAGGVAASIIEQTRTRNDPRTGTPRIIREVTGRVPDGTQVAPTSRVVDGEGRHYAVAAVRQPRNPLWTSDVILDLVRTDQQNP